LAAFLCILNTVTPKLYKAADVCELTGLQPYVLRSWEKEFPGIGVQKSPDSPRLYRQADVDQVVRIKELVFREGLTLAGARRRLEMPSALAPVSSSSARPAAARRPLIEPVEMDEDEVLDVLGADARARIATVRSGLRSLLEALSKAPGAVEIPQLQQVRTANGNGSSRPAPARKVVVAAKRAAPAKRAAAPRKTARPAKRAGR
jgi:DNA-binding transcriptional MerR regulator